MSEETKLHQEEENKEVSSTQTTTDEQKTDEAKEKLTQPLPIPNVKPQSSFKLFAYTGDHSRVKIMNWIRMYENLAKRSDWSDEDMVWNLSSYLEEEAFDFYVEHVLTKNLDWEQAKQSMINRFDQFEIEPFMEFLSCKFTFQTELKEYFKKMRSLGIAAGIKEEDILLGMTRGLPQKIRNEFQFVTSLRQWAAVAFCLQQRLDGDRSSYNKNQPWKGNRGRGGRQNRQKTPRNNRQQNMSTDHHLLQNVTGSNANQDNHQHES